MARRQPIVEFGSLPRDPDRDAVLVDVRRSDRTRSEIVLSGEILAKLERIESEYRARDELARRGLAPKSRLLFIGPPGCGKTLCAEILAAELGLAMLYARFDGIISSYLGETASNLRRLFNYASQDQSVLFFDEFDALGKRRDDPLEIGELKRVIGSFLQLLDSYPRENLVVAATNHEGLLDEALWRRFDEILYLGKPSHEQLIQLMKLRLRSVRKRNVDLGLLAREMENFTFADAERVCLDAAKAMYLASRGELTQDILLAELAEQKGRIALGSPRTPPAT